MLDLVWIVDHETAPGCCPAIHASPGTGPQHRLCSELLLPDTGRRRAAAEAETDHAVPSWRRRARHVPSRPRPFRACTDSRPGSWRWTFVATVEPSTWRVRLRKAMPEVAIRRTAFLHVSGRLLFSTPLKNSAF